MCWVLIAALYTKLTSRLVNVYWETGIKTNSYEDNKTLFCHRKITGWVPETFNRDRTVYHCSLYFQQVPVPVMFTEGKIKYSYLLLIYILTFSNWNIIKSFLYFAFFLLTPSIFFFVSSQNYGFFLNCYCHFYSYCHIHIYTDVKLYKYNLLIPYNFADLYMNSELIIRYWITNYGAHPRGRWFLFLSLFLSCL